MQAVLNAALPIFALIFTGFLCGRFRVFSETATDSINRFAIYLALPALMFLAMSRITPAQAAETGFALAFAGGIALTFAAGFFLSRRRGRRIAGASIEGLDVGYSNVGFMGIPLCLLVFGPDSLPSAVIATLFTACVLFCLPSCWSSLTCIAMWIIGARCGGSRSGCSATRCCWLRPPG